MNRKLTLIFLTLIFASSCKQKFADSFMNSFGYLGKTDTPVAKLEGVVKFQKDNGDKPLSNVHVSVLGYNAITDSNGYFGIYLKKGTYNILLHKDGFKDIKLINYNAQDSQLSHADFLMGKGTGSVAYDIAIDKLGNK